MSDQCTEIPAAITDKIKVLLLGDDPTKAVDIVNNDTYLEEIKDSSWSIVDVVVSHLTIENATGNIPLFKSCENILNFMAKNCKPTETVLELLEHMDNEENDIKFCALLKPLKLSLERTKNKSKSFDWCMNTIKSYVENLPLPDDGTPLEEDDLKSRESRIIDLYKEILSFLKPFIEEASVDNETDNDFRNYLLSLLLCLLGKPICYLPSNLKSAQAISESMVSDICKLSPDCFRFISIVADRKKKDHSLPDEESNSHLFESACHVSDLAYANFYYLLMTNNSVQKEIPQSYDSKLVLHNCFYLACIFLENCEQVFVSKGLNLVECTMLRVEKFSLEKHTLESAVHSKLFSCLTQVMIYSQSKKERKRALEIFKNYVNLFTIEARYEVILLLFKITKHSGLLSLISLIVKDSIVKCLEENPPCPYFLGTKLHTLLSLACKLQHGCMTDLIEIAEEIIAALNLIRFLAIRDVNNDTGFWDYVNVLEKNYLKELRTGIDLSRAHWKVKLKDLENEEKSLKKNSKKIDNIEEEFKVTIQVSGETLSMLPLAEKIKFSHQALNALDMMESVWVRVNECLESHRRLSNSKT